MSRLLPRKRQSLSGTNSHDACQHEIATLKRRINELHEDKAKWSHQSEISEKSTKESDQDFLQLQSSHEDLEQQNRTLTEQLREQGDQLKLAEQQISDSEEEKTRLEHRLAEMEQQNRKLEAKTATFRDIIKKNSNTGGEPVDTNRILVEFSGLRSQIQKIVCGKSFQVDPRARPPITRNTTNRQRALFQYWDNGQSQAELKARIRSEIFAILDEAILFRPCFGLDDASTYGEMERGLVQFEMNLNKISRGKNH